jgi:hypothetical protein
MNSELQLIRMVQKVQHEQHKYFTEKRLYGNSTTQLEICKKLEKELKAYCAKRAKEIEDEINKVPQQSQLF